MLQSRIILLSSIAACVDIYPDKENCTTWAEAGVCEKNPDWMAINCRSSCGLCDVNVSKTMTVKASSTNISLATDEQSRANGVVQNSSVTSDLRSDEWQASEGILVNITSNITLNIKSSAQQQPSSTTSSSSNIRTTQTSLWQISDQSTNQSSTMLTDYPENRTDLFEGTRKSVETEPPNSVLSITDAAQLDEVRDTSLNMNDMSTSAGDMGDDSVPSDERTRVEPMEKESTFDATGRNISSTVNFSGINTTLAGQETSVDEQVTSVLSVVKEVTGVPAEKSPVDDKLRNETSEREGTTAVEDVLRVFKSTTAVKETERSSTMTSSTSFQGGIVAVDDTTEASGRKTMQQKEAKNLSTANKLLEMTTAIEWVTGKQMVTEEKPIFIHTSPESHVTEGASVSDTNNSLAVTSSEKLSNFTTAAMTNEDVSSSPVVSNTTTMITKMSATETPCSNIWDDNHGTLDCEGWAAVGECEYNPIWMAEKCQKACHKCSPPDEQVSGESGHGSSNDECDTWAFYGECESNPFWMLVYCKLACNVCSSLPPGDKNKPFLTTLLPSSGEEEPTVMIPCDEDQFECSVIRECIDISKRCDDNVDCEDGSDEEDDLCQATFTCSENQYQCNDGSCISRTLLCDGEVHCISAEDEDLTLCQSLNSVTNLTISAVTSKEITLSWSESDNTHQLITGYVVSFYKVDNVSSVLTFMYDFDTTSVRIDDLDPETEYVFTVKPMVSYFSAQGSNVTGKTSEATITCLESQYQCIDGSCISRSQLCDGEEQCTSAKMRILLCAIVPETEYVFIVKPVVLYFDTQGTTITGKTLAVLCVNLYTDDPSLCDIWAGAGECEKNVWWMSHYCALSCKACTAPNTAEGSGRSTAGSTTGKLTNGVTSPRSETTAMKAKSSLPPTVLPTTASPLPSSALLSAVQDTAESLPSERAATTFKASPAITTSSTASPSMAVPSTAELLTSAKGAVEQATFADSTPLPTTLTPAWLSTAGHTVGEEITDREQTEYKRDVGSTLEPIQSGDSILIYAEALDGSIVMTDPSQPDSKKTIGKSQKPVAVGYDPVTQNVYWSDVLEHRIYRHSLTNDGTDADVILSVNDGIGVVEGIALDSDNQHLYFCHYLTKVIDGITLKWHSIDVFDLIGRSRHTVISDVDSPRGLWVPFAITLSGSMLYITEWESQSIIKYDTLSETSSVFGVAYLAMGITYSRLKQDKTEDVRCLELDCDGICLHGQDQNASCVCPSYGADVIQPDGLSCQKPDSYMLVADANTVKMLSLTGDDRTVRTVIQGDLLTLYSALIVTGDGTIYYTDTNRQIIYTAVLRDGVTNRELFKANNYIDGLAYNPSTTMLYWTTYADGSIMQLDIESMDSNTIHSGLKNPRDIVLDVNNDYMYWTELGDEPKVMRSYLNGSEKQILLSGSLSSPNGLYLDQGREILYILDSSKVRNRTDVYVCTNLSGPEVSCNVLVSINIQNLLYGIYVHGSVLYFTDWSDPSIHYYDTTSQTFGTISREFVRPTQFDVYGNIPDHCLTARCSDVCMSLLHTYICHCSDGKGPLLADGLTCTKDAVPPTRAPGLEVTTTKSLVTRLYQNATASRRESTKYQNTTSPAVWINQNTTANVIYPELTTKSMETSEMLQFSKVTMTSKSQERVTAVVQPELFTTTQETSMVPDLTKVPEIPVMPNLTTTQKVPIVTTTPKLPEVITAQETSVMPNLTKAPEITVVSKLTTRIKVPKLTTIPKPPEVITAQETSVMPDLTKAPEISVVSKSTTTPKPPGVITGQETSVMPNLTKAPEISVVPKLTTTLKVTKLTTTPKPPEVITAQETSMMPNLTKAPEISVVSKSTTTLKVPKLTTTPKPPEVITAQETSVMPNLTKAPEISVVPKLTTTLKVTKLTTTPKPLEVITAQETSVMPNLTKAPEISVVSKLTTTIKVPKLTTTPKPPEEITAQETSVMPNLTKAPEISVVSKSTTTLKVPKLTTTPKPPEVITAQETSVMPNLTKAPEISVVPKLTTTIKVPKLTTTPKPPEVITAQETSVMPNLTKAPETSVVSKSTTTPKPPEVITAQETSVMPNLTKAPEISVVPKLTTT
ncbi:hypothetical protein LSH36_112g05094 [Paralvinella palmiformis]|uniref:Sortilin-related receptor n=1 Tax=Paralvinella palmiformis TaxID=53620 RepID=A0AAD9JYL5_9ANNE|nr:hypothetical protein LSH36_112g05094 [Paralvinella palmiformis]